MTQFVLAYHGTPQFKSKEDGENHMTAWMAWMKGLGEAVVNPGLPLGASMTIEPDGSVTPGGGANPLAGFTIIEADTMEAALAPAKPCPHLSAGGSMEVAPAMEMSMDGGKQT
jgi:hypothetical protein